MNAPIYLDYQATTPVAPEVAAAMHPWLTDHFANPHSAHKMGRAAAAAVEVARAHVAASMPSGGRVVFTSGATEALNLALIGGARAAAQLGRCGIVTLATEHAAVLDSCRWLEGEGHPLTILPVGADGLVDLAQMEAAITPDTALVAVMQVNNEIGVMQPIDAIADLAHAKGARFVCDAVQGFGRFPAPNAADMIALSGHKIYGPKGIGALWIGGDTTIEPITHGGGQEGGLRSGTLSPALCVGLGVAAKLCADRMEADSAHIETLWRAACADFPDWTLNGPEAGRYHGNLNIRRDGTDVARLMSDCRDVAFSSGSACASGSGRPSHVLSAIGLDTRAAKSSIRLGFGRYTSIDDITRAASVINAAAAQQD
jgi:cysteine desulfurase